MELSLNSFYLLGTPSLSASSPFNKGFLSSLSALALLHWCVGYLLSLVYVLISEMRNEINYIESIYSTKFTECSLCDKYFCVFWEITLENNHSYFEL